MQTLAGLLGTNSGRRFLEAEGVSVSRQAFESRLQLPAQPNVAARFGVEDVKIVCSGQQVYVDYRESVLSKIEVLREMSTDEDLFPFFLWVDTDRSGSDNLISKLGWPPPGKKGPVTILPPGSREVEMRFATVESSVLRSAIDKVGTHLRQSGEQVDGAKTRYEKFRAAFLEAGTISLSEFNLSLTTLMLPEVFGYSPPSLMLARLLSDEVLVAEVDTFVSSISDVITVFNAAIADLTKNDIDPQLTPLPDDYLPLFFSCEADNRRLRLTHQINNGDHSAVSVCKCGRQYRFHLGSGPLSIVDLARTGRWSPDVCFPIFLNDMVSGFVAGKSSSLYLIVLNDVVRKVLGKTPVPILAQVDIEPVDEDATRPDSLIFQYLTGLVR